MLRWLWLAPFTLAFAPTLGVAVPALDRRRSSARCTRSSCRSCSRTSIREQLKQDSGSRRRARRRSASLFLVPALRPGRARRGDQDADARRRSRWCSRCRGSRCSLLGTRRTRELAFPLAIAVFIVPIPTGMLTPIYSVLRPIAAIGTTWTGAARSACRSRASAPRCRCRAARGRGRRQLQRLVDAVGRGHHRARARALLAARADGALVLLASAIPLALVCNVAARDGAGAARPALRRGPARHRARTRLRA